MMERLHFKLAARRFSRILQMQKLAARDNGKTFKNSTVKKLIQQYDITWKFWPCPHVSGFVCMRKHFVADSKVYASTCTYADSLRFRASTRIRENDTNTPDLLTEHALPHVMNPRCC